MTIAFIMCTQNSDHDKTVLGVVCKNQNEDERQFSA